MPANRDNEAGYWESPAIMALHDELLHSVGSSWDDCSEFPRSWFDTPIAASFEERMASVVREEYGDAPLIVVKDPRACRLVPMWLSIFAAMNIEPSVVIPIRNPIEVAKSLRTRNGFSIRQSLLLWLQNFLAAERDSRMIKRSFVSYAHLLENWCEVVDRIGTDLNLDWPIRSAAMVAAIDEFLQVNLRHNESTFTELSENNKVPASVQTAYLWALRATEGGPIDTSVLDVLYNNVPVASEKQSLLFDGLGRQSRVNPLRKLRWTLANALRRAEGLFSFLNRRH